MSPSDDAQDRAEKLREEAAEFLVALHQEEVSEEQIQSWQRWLALSGAHRETYDQLEAVWLTAEGVSVTMPSNEECARDSYDGSISIEEWRATESKREDRTEKPPAPRIFWSRPARRTAVGLGIALAALTVAVMPISLRWKRNSEALVYETQVGETRNVKLSDGSHMALGDRTLVWVTLGEHLRTIRFERGEAFFHVAKDSSRPFTVLSQGTAVTAVGTAFDIRRSDGNVIVTVAEGSVRVEGQRETPKTSETIVDSPVTVAAGHLLMVNRTRHIERIADIDKTMVADWRNGRFRYLDEPLGSVIADINRHTNRDIQIADKVAAELRVTASITHGGEDSWIKSLPTALAVRVTQTADGRMTIESRGAR